MIAKAATISHGANAIRYSVNKDRADTVKVNLLPDGGWGRDRDEDDLEWAHRCARMANRMCRRRQGLHR